MRILIMMAALCLAIPASLHSPVRAQSLAPLEAYGELPDYESFALSPDGSRFAFLARQNETTLLAVFENGKGNIATVDVGEVKALGINFITNKHLIVIASYYKPNWGGYESVRAFSYDIEAGEIAPLKDLAQTFSRAFTATGFAISPTNNPDEIFYGTYDGGNAVLLRANLSTGDVAIIDKVLPFNDWTAAGVDWVVNKEGVILGREEFDWRKGEYRIFTKREGEDKLIFEQQEDLEGKSLMGSMPDGAGLVIIAEDENPDFVTLHSLSFDGVLSEPLFQTAYRPLRSIVTSSAGELLGVSYGGFKAEYEFFDPELTVLMNALAARFPSDNITLIDNTDDLSQLVLSVEGGGTAPAYFLYDRNTHGLSKLTPKYERITDNDIMPVQLITYTARDGLSIPAVLTHPKKVSQDSALPLVVIPHGGPESHDDLGFADWAQYFASRGYLVLQPNFRGSSGFGLSHRNAGHGEYGGKMQTDVLDGVKYLVDAGWADPSRICIIGASYGGYTSLTNAALAPQVFNCVAAVAPVTDIVDYMRIRRRAGHDSYTVRYLLRLYGLDLNDINGMARISPVNMADDIVAPVLLIHGSDDTVVPISQSRAMEKALKNAGKTVRFIELKGEDHWLSNNETRLETLQAFDRFVRETIGPAQ